MAARCGGGVGVVCAIGLSYGMSSFSGLSAGLRSLVRMPVKESGLKMSATWEVGRMGPRDAARRKRCKIDHEKMDEWMPEAVVEIVRNLKQAPLLVQVYDSGGKCGAARVKTERAAAEEWAAVKGSWDGEGAPEGVILVEELGGDEASKAWGVLIQGRGGECGPVCYLLKTSRVRSGADAGCTHFCLTKVSSFTETAFSQLTDCWLLP